VMMIGARIPITQALSGTVSQGSSTLTTELAINTLVLPQYTEVFSALFPGCSAVCPVTTFWRISKTTERDALSSSTPGIFPASEELKRRRHKTWKWGPNCLYTETSCPFRGDSPTTRGQEMIAETSLDLAVFKGNCDSIHFAMC